MFWFLSYLHKNEFRVYFAPFFTLSVRTFGCIFQRILCTYSDLNWLFNVKVLILVQNILLIYRYLQFAYHQYLKQAIYVYGSYGTFTECQDMRKSLGKLFQQWGSTLYDFAFAFSYLFIRFHEIFPKIYC